MLNIDFSNIVKKETQKSVKLSKKAIHIGDSRRFSSLPDTVDETFIERYKDTLDQFLYPYVAKNKITISYASRYAQSILNNIFGNEHHLGIYQYLKDKNIEGISDKELVIQAEKLLLQGWNIRQENNHYWLYNSDLQKVIEMTGSSEEAVLADAQELDSSNAHLFFDERVASKITAFAERLGYDADTLSLTNSFDILLSKTENKQFIGYLTNYDRLKTILSKPYKYRTLTVGTSMYDLYEEGYRLSDTLVPKGVVLSNGQDDVIIFPAESEINTTHTLNKFLISQKANELREAIYSQFKKVKFQSITPLKELRHVYAYYSDFWDTDLVKNSFIESQTILSRLESKVEETLAVVVVTEALLLGNNWFSSSGFGIDSITENFYVYFNHDAFTRPSVESSGYEENAVYRFRNPKDYISKLPKRYEKVLRSIEFTSDDYVQDLKSVQDYFETARNYILKELS